MQRAISEFRSNQQSKLRRRRGVVLTPSGLKRFQDAIHLSEIKENRGDRYTLEQLSDRVGVSTKTLSRLWSLNSGVDQKTMRLCFSTFDLDLNPGDYTTVSDTTVDDPEESDEEAAPSPFAKQRQPTSPPTSPTLNPLPDNASTPERVPSSQPVQSRLLSLPYPGGPLPPDSPFYINRAPIEELAHREVVQPGCVIRIRAPRGMGKSSLAVRLLSFAESLGYGTVLLDCNDFDGDHLTHLNKLLRSFCQRVSVELGIPPRLNDYWDEDIGSKLSCTLYFKQYLLQQVKAPFVLAINGIDCLFEHQQIAHEFFPMLRSWHEAARRDRDWQKLRQAVIYCTEDYPALDINCSPFNVGLPLSLPEFTPEQVQDLANRYGLNWSLDQVELLMALVGGHPTLIQIAFYYLCCEGMALETLLQQAAIDGGVFDYYLRQRWSVLQKKPHLVEAIAAVVKSEQSIPLDFVIAYQLESQGLIRYEGDAEQFPRGGNRVKPFCRLYRVYFKQQLSAPPL